MRIVLPSNSFEQCQAAIDRWKKLLGPDAKVVGPVQAATGRWVGSVERYGGWPVS